MLKHILRTELDDIRASLTVRFPEAQSRKWTESGLVLDNYSLSRTWALAGLLTISSCIFEFVSVFVSVFVPVFVSVCASKFVSLKESHFCYSLWNFYQAIKVGWPLAGPLTVCIFICVCICICVWSIFVSLAESHFLLLIVKSLSRNQIGVAASWPTLHF